MNTLIKGDKVNSPYGLATVESLNQSNGVAYIETEDGKRRRVLRSDITRIPSFEEEMESVLAMAWDVENRLEDDETVQLKVGQFVKFARHYVAMRDQLVECQQYYKSNAEVNRRLAEMTEKLLKGETTI